MTYSLCQNCSTILTEDELVPARDLGQRVAPGEPFPSGECPDCGALCQELDRKHISKLLAKAAKQRAALDETLSLIEREMGGDIDGLDEAVGNNVDFEALVEMVRGPEDNAEL